jgi:hypothetical protein
VIALQVERGAESRRRERIVRRERKDAPIGGDRVVEAALMDRDARDADERRGRVRLDRACLLVVDARAREIADSVKRIAVSAMRSSLIALGAELRITGRVSDTCRVVVVQPAAAARSDTAQPVRAIRRA